MCFDKKTQGPVEARTTRLRLYITLTCISGHRRHDHIFWDVGVNCIWGRRYTGMHALERYWVLFDIGVGIGVDIDIEDSWLHSTAPFCTILRSTLQG